MKRVKSEMELRVSKVSDDELCDLLELNRTEFDRSEREAMNVYLSVKILNDDIDEIALLIIESGN